MSREVEELEARIRELELEIIALMRQHAKTIVRERWIRERFDVESVAHRSVAELGPMLDVDHVVLRLREGGRWPIVASWSCEELEGLRFPAALSFRGPFSNWWTTRARAAPSSRCRISSPTPDSSSTARW